MEKCIGGAPLELYQKIRAILIHCNHFDDEPITYDEAVGKIHELIGASQVGTPSAPKLMCELEAELEAGTSSAGEPPVLDANHCNHMVLDRYFDSLVKLYGGWKCRTCELTIPLPRAAHADTDEVRRLALEEAAQIAESCTITEVRDEPFRIAQTIRALAASPAPAPQEETERG